MRKLPNELIIHIYSYLDFENTLYALIIFPFLHFLAQEKAKNTPYIWDIYSIKGQLEVVKWLHENAVDGPTIDAMNLAAGSGQLEIVKFLHYNRTEGCTELAIDYAACQGHLEVVKWLYENRYKGFTKKTFTIAANSGHSKITEYLLNQIN